MNFSKFADSFRILKSSRTFCYIPLLVAVTVHHFLYYIYSLQYACSYTRTILGRYQDSHQNHSSLQVQVRCIHYITTYGQTNLENVRCRNTSTVLEHVCARFGSCFVIIYIIKLNPASLYLLLLSPLNSNMASVTSMV